MRINLTEGSHPAVNAHSHQSTIGFSLVIGDLRYKQWNAVGYEKNEVDYFLTIIIIATVKSRT
jgi:hypothetical protein